MEYQRKKKYFFKFPKSFRDLSSQTNKKKDSQKNSLKKIFPLCFWQSPQEFEFNLNFSLSFKQISENSFNLDFKISFIMISP